MKSYSQNDVEINDKQFELDENKSKKKQKVANKNHRQNFSKWRKINSDYCSYSRPELLERVDLLPNQVDVDQTDELFRKVVVRAQTQLRNDAGDKKMKTAGIFGVPDGIVVEKGKITKVVEAKDWEPDVWKKMAEFAKRDPENFVKTKSDKKKYRNIQFDKHMRSIQYILDNLHVFPEARQLGIAKKTDINDLIYVLKVKTTDPKDAIETIRETYEKQGYKTEVQYVDLERKMQEFEKSCQNLKAGKRENINTKRPKLTI
ncbi:MAG: hypothetical protein IMW92_14325 [Bacillales bacterium]|nr:hypothetical protein [Bacillales bacterium]